MRSMMFLRTITLVGPASFSALPSKIRTFLNRVTVTSGAAVAALAAPELAGGDGTVAGTVVGAAPLAALPASDPDGAPDGAQLAESMSAAIAVRNRTISRMEASLAGSVSRDGTLFFSACRREILPRKRWVATCPPWSICVTAVRRVERQCCASVLRRRVRLDVRAIDCARWPTRDRRPECSEELRNNVANRSPHASQPNTPSLGARAECRREK